MKISSRLESILIHQSFYYSSAYSNGRKTCIHREDVNTRFLRTVKEGEFFIVPIPILTDFVVVNYGHSNNKNLVYPLSITRPYNIKTVDSLISSLLKYSMIKDGELMKIVSEKYGTYYGARGVIMDSAFNILLLNACRCTIEEGFVHIKETITYVNPIVSLMDNSVDKHIYTKILPTYLHNTVFTNIPNHEHVSRDVAAYGKPTIILKDATDMFLAKPIEPSESMNEGIYNILDNNIDEILEMAVKCQ